MIIDHIGIVVKSIEKGIKHWESVFGYVQYTDIVENSRQRVKVVFLRKGNSLPVKLVEPVDEKSPVYRFAQKGGGLHHLCFKCDNIEQEVVRMKKMGLRVLVPPQPGEAFGGENIAFIFAKQGINIELIDTEFRSFVLSSRNHAEPNNSL